MQAYENWAGRRISEEDSRKLLGSLLSKVFEAGADKSPIRALEAGCGEGQFSSGTLWRAFSSNHPDPRSRLFSLDIAFTSLMAARRRFRERQAHGARPLQGDLYNLPVAAQSCDYLLAFNVFYWADRSRLLSEAHRVLKEDGRLFTYDLVPTPIDGLRPVFFFHLRRDQIRHS